MDDIFSSDDENEEPLASGRKQQKKVSKTKKAKYWQN